MQEDYKLVYWIAVTDKGEYRLSEQELDILLKADASGSRFVRLDKIVLNPAFIKEIYRKVELRQNAVLSEADKKYLEGAPEGSKLLA
jgi:hypothetical protein